MEYRLGKDQKGAVTVFAAPVEGTEAENIDQYSSYADTEEIIAAIHERYFPLQDDDHDAREVRFCSVLAHFSHSGAEEPDVSSTSDKGYPKLLKQWRLCARVVRKKTAYHCICSKKVIDLRFIRNTKNGNVLLVGTCCLRRYIAGSKLDEDGVQFEQLLEKACRQCAYKSPPEIAGEDGEQCPTICYAPDMRGPYCVECYEHLSLLKRTKYEGKKYCAHCFELHKIAPSHRMCDECHSQGKTPLIKTKEDMPVTKSCGGCGETMETLAKETWRRLCENCYKARTVDMTCADCGKSYYVLKGKEYRDKCRACYRKAPREHGRRKPRHTQEKEADNANDAHGDQRDKTPMVCRSCRQAYSVAKGEEWKKLCIKCYRKGVF